MIDIIWNMIGIGFIILLLICILMLIPILLGMWCNVIRYFKEKE